MIKTCVKPGCVYPIFSHRYCKSHQYMRNDIKHKNNLEKRLSKEKTHIKEKAKDIADCAKKDKEFYLSIWDKRIHKCTYCDAKLVHEPSNFMFDHLLEKSKFPNLRYEEDDIALTCLLCHGEKTAGKYNERMKDAIVKAVKIFSQRNMVHIIGDINFERIKDWVIPIKQ